MSNRILALDDLNEHTLEDVLREVAEQRQTVTVQLPEGESVIIKPAPRLRPLPVLEGFVPEGWKDAIYQ